MRMGRDEQAVREAFRRMGPREKASYILTYYWWAILLTVTAAAVLGSVIHGRLTRKQTLLYIACLNVSAGSDLEETLREALTAAEKFGDAAGAALAKLLDSPNDSVVTE